MPKMALLRVSGSPVGARVQVEHNVSSLHRYVARLAALKLELVFLVVDEIESIMQNPLLTGI